MNSILLVFGLLMPLFLVACEQQGANGMPTVVQNTTPPVGVPTEGTSQSDVLAKINGLPVTDAEVTERVKGRLKKLESQIFDIKRDGLDEMLEEKLLEAEAKKRNLSVDELLRKEVDDKIEAPSEQDLQTFHGMLKNQLGDKPLSEVREKLIGQIKNTRKRDLYAKFMENLEEDANVEVFMERPRIPVTVDDDPVKGKKDAPITLIEFSDFQCPFCKRARATVNQILETYGGKIQYSFRDYPLPFHKLAPKAHEAATCAGDQGKYWEYNSLLWDKQPDLAVNKLKEYAGQLKLDQKKFDACLDTGKYAGEIEKDIQEGSQAGVSGTPAYFINGILISGAQPFENFKQVIDDELKEKKRAKN